LSTGQISANKIFLFFTTLRRYPILLMCFILVILILTSSIVAPQILQPRQFMEIIRQGTSVAIAGMGQTTVMLVRGADLSIGEIVTLTNIFASDLMGKKGQAVLWVCILCLLMGAFIGFINGLVIVNTNIPPLVMTLGMAWMLRGISLVYSGGAPTGSIPPILRFIGGGDIAGFFPVAVIVLAIVAAIGIIFLSKTSWGAMIYYTGSNPRAAYLSGVPVKKITILAYIISGVSAAIAGLLLSGYIGIGTFRVGGMSLTLNSFAASVLGGTTFAGGEGGLTGTVLGAIIIQFLNSLVIILGLGEPGKLIMRGIIIVGMVTLYTRRKS